MNTDKESNTVLYSILYLVSNIIYYLVSSI